MTFEIDRLPAGYAIVDQQGRPDPKFSRWWEKMADHIESQINDILAVQAAAAAAQAAADTAATAAAAAQTAADAAQEAADNAQATADAIDVPPSGGRTVTANDSFGSSDYAIFADATAGPITIILPPASSGREVVVKKVDASANVVTVDAAGADDIQGSPTYPLAAQYDFVRLVADGVSQWLLS